MPTNECRLPSSAMEPQEDRLRRDLARRYPHFRRGVYGRWRSARSTCERAGLGRVASARLRGLRLSDDHADSVYWSADSARFALSAIALQSAPFRSPGILRGAGAWFVGRRLVSRAGLAAGSRR